MSESIECLYIIRAKEEGKAFRMGRLGELERILKNDSRARLEHVIEPIAAVIAFVYDAELVKSLEDSGYELLPQARTKMIETKSYKEKIVPL